MQGKPNWMAAYYPSLDGLRGLAIALVLLYHCDARLTGLGLGWLGAGGWSGVNLFFVLSGFLITGIILDERARPRFFRNFYARRALRIWPVYALVVPLNWLILGRVNTWARPGPAWIYFVFFIQNLTPGLTGTIYPAWSLAIEEQFYLVWAPVARRLPAAGLAGLLAAVLAAEPWLRARELGRFVPVHTLYHLDGLAVGALAALGLRTLGGGREGWRRLGWIAVGAGAAGTAAAWRWADAGLDTALAALFGGMLLVAVTGEGAPSLAVRALSLRPLRGLGRISYGLYLIHLPVFALLGGVDAHMDRIHAGAAGDALILALRWSAAIGLAALLWVGFERPILRLKRYFSAAAAREAPVAAA